MTNQSTTIIITFTDFCVVYIFFTFNSLCAKFAFSFLFFYTTSNVSNQPTKSTFSLSSQNITTHKFLLYYLSLLKHFPLFPLPKKNPKHTHFQKNKNMKYYFVSKTSTSFFHHSNLYNTICVTKTHELQIVIWINITTEFIILHSVHKYVFIFPRFPYCYSSLSIV